MQENNNGFDCVTDMQAWEINNHKMRLIETPVPEVPTGYALLKVRQMGICHTDLELLHGYQNFSGIPGHEFVATVMSSPTNPGWW